MENRYTDLSIRKLSNGKWQGLFYYYPKPGERKQKTKVSNKKLKKDAKPELEQWRKEWIECYEEQQGLVDADETVYGVCKHYLDYQLSLSIIEPSTHASNRLYIEKYVKPYDFGSLGFKTVERIDCEKWLTELFARGLKTGTVHTAYAQVNKTYNHYLRVGDIDKNPFQFVRTPKKSDSKATFLESKELNRMLTRLNQEQEEGSVLWTVINLACLGGLRRGEICGLRWHDINFEANTLTVSTSIGVMCGQYGQHEITSATYAKKPKNESSERTFPMIPQLQQVLNARMNYVCGQYGTVEPSWFVCGDTIHYLAPTTASRRVKEFMTRNGIKDYQGRTPSLHDLRHNFATMGVNAHMDIASLSLMMGHASKAMTLDTYASASPEALKQASQKLGNVLGEIETLEIADNDK